MNSNIQAAILYAKHLTTQIKNEKKMAMKNKLLRKQTKVLDDIERMICEDRLVEVDRQTTINK